MTEEQLKIAAEILSKNKEALYDFRWLWNKADTPFVQNGYFMSFLQHCEAAIEEAKKK
jgi:hypothetical protein